MTFPTQTQRTEAIVFPARAREFILDAGTPGSTTSPAAFYQDPVARDAYYTGILHGMAILLGHSTDEDGLTIMFDKITALVGR